MMMSMIRVASEDLRRRVLDRICTACTLATQPSDIETGRAEQLVSGLELALSNKTNNYRQSLHTSSWETINVNSTRNLFLYFEICSTGIFDASP